MSQCVKLMVIFLLQRRIQLESIAVDSRTQMVCLMRSLNPYTRQGTRYLPRYLYIIPSKLDRGTHLIDSLAEEHEEDDKDEPEGVIQHRHKLIKAQHQQREDGPQGRPPIASRAVSLLRRLCLQGHNKPMRLQYPRVEVTFDLQRLLDLNAEMAGARKMRTMWSTPPLCSQSEGCGHVKITDKCADLCFTAYIQMHRYVASLQLHATEAWPAKCTAESCLASI